jgi:putative PIN family toxin of toxin-antitoxin system
VIIVTADTNVYVSGLEFGGVPLAFLELGRAGAFRFAVSDALLAELREVLCLKFAWSEEAVTSALSQLHDCSVHVRPTEILDVIQDDPDDNRIPECAIAAQAGFIVSGDNHLLHLGRFRGIRVLKVADFMALLPTL